LAAAVNDSRNAVRTVALQHLFATISAQVTPGGALAGELGVRTFREILLPIFSELPEPSDTDTQPTAAALDWMRGTGVAALALLERTFCTAFGEVGEMLEEVIALLVRCLQQRSGGLAHVAAEALLHLVKETGANFSQETWASVCAELKSCFDSGAGDSAAVEAQAVTADAGTTTSPLLREVSAKVEAEAPPGSGPHELQVLLLSTVYQLLHSMYPSMKLGDVDGLLNCMHSMYDKSHRVVQEALGDGGADGEAPVLDEEALHLQLEAESFYLQVLFFLFAKIKPGLTPPAKGQTPPLGSDAHVLLIASAAEYRLVSFCLHVLRDYLQVHEQALARDSDMAPFLLKQLTPNVVMLLQGILSFHEPQFVRHLPGFYPIFVDLMHCDSKQIRQTLRDIFSHRVGTVLQQQQRVE
jgi:brefeldin A-inhibited guanine nucleotide-exchange protein